MDANDPRHGRRSGYIAGCRCGPCSLAHYRYQKKSRLRLLTEGTQTVDATPLVHRLAWWVDRGVAVGAVADAAGLGEGTLKELVLGERDVCLRSTLNATLAVTWDDIPARALCSAELTRRRVFSLMASGYPLAWISDNADGLPLSGRWRNQQKVYVSTARAVAHLSATAAPVGPSTATATKARNKGHLPLMGWDDPGVPSMPTGWAPEVPTTTQDEADAALIELYLAGDFTHRAPKRLKADICRAWAESGRSLRALADHTGWATHRYYRMKDEVA